MPAPGGQTTPGGDKQGWGRELGPFLTLGLQLAITVVAFFFIGRWVDGQLGTGPWLMLAGLGIGMVGGFLKFFRVASRLGRESDRNAPND